MTMDMNTIQKAKTALREPERVPPYALKRSTVPARKAATWWWTRGLDGQKDRLDAFRSHDEYLLIVLDACRWDYFRAKAPMLLAGEMDVLASEGHDTFEYVNACWGDDHPDVTYVSGATPVASSRYVDFDDPILQEFYGGFKPGDHIGEIVDSWRRHWDDSVGTVPPEPVVADALERRDEPELVCHLFQPHAPYIGDVSLHGHTDNENAKPKTGEPVDAPLWERVRQNKVSKRELKAAYRANLRRALDAACWLIQETDRPTVVMADHGEALGEYGVYSHPRTPHPKVRRVPWCEVDGLTETGAACAEIAQQRLDTTTTTSVTDSTTERLESLGYL